MPLQPGPQQAWRSLPVVIAALLLLFPLLFAGFFEQRAQRGLRRLSTRQLCSAAACFCVPYVLVAVAFHVFSFAWFLLYLLLPPGLAACLAQARGRDPQQKGNWRDFAALAVLGLAVDLRWFEHAWPAHLSVFNKVLLLDAGLLAIIGARRLDGVGFDLRVRPRDLFTGGREFLFYAPAAIFIGIELGFLHWHRGWPRPGATVTAALFTFFFIAVPEELFFRGWLQNLLERRLGRSGALAVTSVLFGLAHFNKRAAHFNWRYVLLAALAGVFYGRAWRRDRRVAASALTHTLVDTVWSLTLR